MIDNCYVTSFTVDSVTNETLERLKEHYHLETKGEVLRWAITLLSIVSKNEDIHGFISIVRDDGSPLKVMMKS